MYDSFLQVPLRDYVKKNHPRLLFVGYGEADNWAHSGRYDLVLESARGYDQFVHELWDLVQSLPEYRNQTTSFLARITAEAADRESGANMAPNKKAQKTSG